VSIEKIINPFDFKDKVILITGAGNGIGKELAIQLNRNGAKLILLDVSKDLLGNLEDVLGKKSHTFITFDISNLNDIENLIKDIYLINGKFDGFVHCVGLRSRRPLSMIKPDYLSKILSINFGSFIETIRCITKKGRYNEHMSIVGISSIASIRGASGVSAYAASKSAMDGAIRCLAKELSQKMIRVNSVIPSQINTPAYEEFLLSNNGGDSTLKRQYLGLGESIDVANAIMFLLSPISRFITGISLPVDGGYLNS